MILMEMITSSVTMIDKVWGKGCLFRTWINIFHNWSKKPGAHLACDDGIFNMDREVNVDFFGRILRNNDNKKFYLKRN